MAIPTTASTALPEKGSWGSFARRLLDAFAAASEHYQQERMMLAVGELDHPGRLADTEAALHRRDAARMRGIFEGFSVMVPEGKTSDRI